MQIQELDHSQELRDAFQVYAENPTDLLLLVGKNGTGKTTIAEAIYESARIISVPEYNDKHFFIQFDLTAKWLKTLNQFGEVGHFLDEIAGTPLLVIDDLGTRDPTTAFKDFLYAVIEKRERHRSKRGTIITTNLNSEDTEKMFGSAFLSRIASGLVFRFEGPDKRLKNLRRVICR